MKSNKLVSTLVAMRKYEMIPASMRRAAIREKLVTAFSEVRLAVFDTRMGWIGVAWNERGIVALNLPRASREHALRDLRRDYPAALLYANAPFEIVRALQEYAAGRAHEFHIALDWSALKPFQRAVLEAAQKIPFGETRSYGWIAKQIGKPRASRAVGQALRTNPIPIILPCHRVISGDGGLGGYAGGLSLKRKLLTLEGAIA
jgi:methylated-DNA-[protein]-cysteine S-methyltransferase